MQLTFKRLMILCLMMFSTAIVARAQEMLNPTATPSKFTDIMSPNFACGYGQRTAYFFDRGAILTDKMVQVGDSWDGVIVQASICGGCAIFNAPGAPPVYTDPAHPLNVKVDWGDSVIETLSCTTGASPCSSPSSSLRIEPNGQITGHHKFSVVNETPQPMTAEISAQCITPDSNWRETVNNRCEIYPAAFGCGAHPANLTVFGQMKPVAITVTKTLNKKVVNVGAIAIYLEKAAPGSGMKMQMASDNLKVKFTDYLGHKSNPAIVMIPAGITNYNFDLDATRIVSPTSVRISIEGDGVTKTTSSVMIR